MRSAGLTSKRQLSLLVLSAAFAAVSEWLSFDSGDDLGLTVADGVVGAVLLGSAVIAWDRRRGSFVGLLMGLAGLTWLAGTLWPAVVFLHRGPLVHLHLSYPSGRLGWRPALVTVVAVYMVSTIEAFAGNDGLTLAVAAAVALVAAGALAHTTGTARRAGIPALVAAVAFAAALSLGSVNRLGSWQSDRATLWIYYAVVAGAVALLLVDLLRGRWAEAVVTGLVVDLGRRAGTATLRGELARALGDPTLTIGYWVPAEQRYVDDAGRRLDVASHPPGRAVTFIDHDGDSVAMLVHDIAVLDDGALVESVTAAARMAVINVRLQADARERVDELAASRRRIVEAADEQRRRLGQDLRDEVYRRLDRVALLIAEVRRNAEVEPIVADVDAELHGVRIDLDELSRGIYPLALIEGGLAAALPPLARRAAVPVELAVAVPRLAPAIEAALYFVCSEALANLAKHSGAARASVTIALTDGAVTAVVNDDGCGGADPDRGSGLRGLADRVEAFAGRLSIISNDTAGTRLEATIPIQLGPAAGVIDRYARTGRERRH